MKFDPNHSDSLAIQIMHLLPSELRVIFLESYLSIMLCDSDTNLDLNSADNLEESE
jgi:hypothetical protein